MTTPAALCSRCHHKFEDVTYKFCPMCATPRIMHTDYLHKYNMSDRLAMAMNLALWSNLPKELLHRVFARLPRTRIRQLRFLSKEWKTDIDTRGSEFNQVLEERPCYLGLIASENPGDFSTSVYDVKASRRKPCFEIDIVKNYMVATNAADGGLVCFFSECPLCLTVINPLTKQKLQLPPLLGFDVAHPTLQIAMVQLTMNRQTKRYEVFFAGYKESEGRGLFAQVYDSESKRWASVGSGEQCIFGYKYAPNYEYYNVFDLVGVSVYDIAEGRLLDFSVDSIVQRPAVNFEHCALLNDRFFVLEKETVSEYHLPKNATDWVKVAIHRCDPFVYCFCSIPEDSWELVLYACTGFLFLSLQISPENDDNELMICLIGLGFTTCQLVSGVSSHRFQETRLICELNKNATP